jgi:outer membrane protein assembly factor BamB
VGIGPGAVFWSTDSLEGIAGIAASRAATGSTLWRFNCRQPGVDAWYAGGIVLANNDGILTALDARTGRRVWGTKPSSYVDSVVAERGTFYVSGYPDISGEPGWQIAAIHPSTGARRWSTGINSGLLGLAVGDGVVCGTEDQNHRTLRIFAVDASDGRMLWQRNSNSSVQAISGGFVITVNLGSLTGSPTTLRARHASSGAQAWHRTMAGVSVQASGSKSVYVGGASDNLITALAADTGRTLWTHRLSAPADAAAAAGNALYVIDADATVYAIQA